MSNLSSEKFQTFFMASMGSCNPTVKVSPLCWCEWWIFWVTHHLSWCLILHPDLPVHQMLQEFHAWGSSPPPPSCSWSSQPSLVENDADLWRRLCNPSNWLSSSFCSSSLLTGEVIGSFLLFHLLRSFCPHPLVPLHLSFIWLSSSSTSWLACL